MEAPIDLVAGVRLGDHDADPWFIVVRDCRGVTYGVPCLPEGEGLRRALPGDGAAEALLRTLAAAREGRSENSTFVTRWHSEQCDGERGVDVDQTNELIVVGERAVVKWMLHPTADDQPAPRRLAALAKAGFAGTPRPWGLVSIDEGGERRLIATVIEHIARARDGWEWAVDDVRSLARGEKTFDEATGSMAVIGRLVAEMHLAFAAQGRAMATREQAEAWLSEADEDVRDAALNPMDAALVAQEISVIADFAGATLIDVHGDLHIGQILRAERPDELWIIDFDGNPTRSPQQRLAQQPAARDVAGMLASLDHVGRVVLFRTDDLDADQRRRVLDWIVVAQHAFVDAYSARLAASGEERIFEPRLVRPLQFQQECREFIYASRYLPHWRYVPEGALAHLLSTSAASPSGNDDEGVR
jgi:maltokinase